MPDKSRAVIEQLLDSKEVLRDPYAMYRVLRQRSPVMHYAPLNAWVVSRHEDVQRLLLSRQVTAGGGRFTKGFRVLPPAAQQHAERLRLTLSRMMLFQDPPDHTRLRRFLNTRLTAEVMSRVGQSIDAAIAQLLGRLGEGPVDIVDRLAQPLPTRVICELLSIPDADQARLIEWVDDLADFFVAAPPTETQLMRAIESTAHAEDYLLHLCNNTCGTAPAGLIGLLKSYVDDQGDRLTNHEVASQCILFLFGGQETARNAIAVGARALIERPPLRELLLSGEEGAGQFVEEMLRLESPVQWVARATLEEIEIADTKIPAGQTLILVIGSANRDERVFDAPDEFRGGRPGRSLAFGHGAHKCIGESIAMTEITRCLRAFVTRYPDARLVDAEPEWHPQLALRGLSRLRVQL